MKNIELNQLKGYLGTELKCQYIGIINGSEISSHKKEFEKENTPYTNWEYFEPIERIEGLKVGLLKEIHVFKNYWTCRIGIKHGGLKGFYLGKGFKLILHPLTDITNEDTIAIHGLGSIELELINIKEWTEELIHEIKTGQKFKLSQFEYLYNKHFDIHGLIKKGLAIDINTL